MDYSYNKICRICISEEKKLEELFSLTLTSDNIHAVDFIRKITGLKILKSDTLPKSICENCIIQLNNAFQFAQLCISSEESLRKQETRRIFCKIEEEALADELPIKQENDIQSQQFIQVNNDLPDENNLSDDEELQSSETKSYYKYKCRVCSAPFNNKTKFLKHEKTHDNTKPFKCDHCLQTFSKKIYLNVHLRSHIKAEDKKYSCSKCGQQFIFQYLLKQHEFKHSDDKPFPCKKCDKGCLTEQSLKRHMATHDENYSKKLHSCKICGKQFSYPSFLSEHMKNHTGEKPYLCSVCGKGFRQSGALHYHQRIHTGYKPFKCKTCDENFMSQSVLKVHERKHTNERPYVCDSCGMAFRQSTDLRSHKRTHTGDKPVLCTICGKRMSTTGQLTVHIRSHTGEKPFSCSTCTRAFTTRTMLIKHQRIHTGERPYICDICGRAFNQSSTLRTHAKIHNPDNPTKKKRTPKTKTKKTEEFMIKDCLDDDTNKLLTSTVIEINPCIIEKEEHEIGKTEFTVILPTPIPNLL